MVSSSWGVISVSGRMMGNASDPASSSGSGNRASYRAADWARMASRMERL